MPSPDIKLATDSRGVATISFQGIKSLNIVGSAEVESLTRSVASLAGREDLRLLVLTGAVAEWVTAILERSPQAIRAQKELFRLWEKLPPTEAAEASIPVFARCFESGEPNEYLRKFLKKNKG